MHLCSMCSCFKLSLMSLSLGHCFNMRFLLHGRVLTVLAAATPHIAGCPSFWSLEHAHSWRHKQWESQQQPQQPSYKQVVIDANKERPNSSNTTQQAVDISCSTCTYSGCWEGDHMIPTLQGAVGDYVRPCLNSQASHAPPKGDVALVRGNFTELFRKAWSLECMPSLPTWNYLTLCVPWMCMHVHYAVQCPEGVIGWLLVNIPGNFCSSLHK